MNAKLLSLSIVPMLLMGSGQALASVRTNHLENWHLSRLSQKIDQPRLGTQQPPPFYRAGKDDKKKECQWLGLCDGKDKKK
jgi:hypothetical protein